jgi:hypothetical protein
MGLRYVYLTLILTVLLGCHEGFIALWKHPQQEPAVIFPYRITSLPPADREQLLRGIQVETKDELMGLLEDYLS